MVKSWWRVQKRHSQTAEYLQPLIQLLFIFYETFYQATESNGKTVTMKVTRLNIGRFPTVLADVFRVLLSSIRQISRTQQFPSILFQNHRPWILLKSTLQTIVLTTPLYSGHNRNLVLVFILLRIIATESFSVDSPEDGSKMFLHNVDYHVDILTNTAS
jgi:hypothetical protein